MATVKQYNLAGLNANVELGKQGSYIAGTANAVSFYTVDSALQALSIANAVASNQAVTLAQLNAEAQDLVQHITVDVSHTSGTANIATISAGSRILSVTVEINEQWNAANNTGTFIEVGDTDSGSRFIRSQDVDVLRVDQYHSQYQYKYLTEGTLTYSVTAGGATGGNAIISVVLATDYALDTDTSAPAPTPTYSVTSASNTVNEGSNATFTVTTTNLADQTLRFKVFSNSNIVAAPSLLAATSTDFNSISGTNPFNSYVNFSVTSNTGSFTVPIVNDGVNNSALTWSGIAAPEARSWRSVATDGAGVWVAVAEGLNRVMRSTDNGVTWSAVTGVSNSWRSVAYGNGVWVAVSGSGTVMRSTNGGVNWSSVTAGVPFGPLSWNSVATDGANVWVAVGSDPFTDAGTYYINTPAVHIEAFPGDPGSVITNPAGFDDPSIFKPPVTFGKVMRSADNGATWSAITSPKEIITWISVSYGDGVWVAVASDMSAPVYSLNPSYNPEFDGNGTAYGEPGYMPQSQSYDPDNPGERDPLEVTVNAVDTGERIMRSTNGGVDWSTNAVSRPTVLYTSLATDGEGVWVAVSQSGANRVMRSTDNGLNWSDVAGTAENSPAWKSVAYGDGVWVAVADFTFPTGPNRVMRSINDGASWTVISSGVAVINWQSVAYGDGAWVAVSNSGANQIMRSIGDRSFYVEIADADSNTALANSNVVTIIDSGSP